MNNPYTLADRAALKMPSILLPQAGRDKLKREIETIRVAYKTQFIRAQAVDLLVDQVRAEYPFAFQSVK